MDSAVTIELPAETIDVGPAASGPAPPKLTIVKRFSMMRTPRKKVHRGSHTPRAGKLARKLGDKSAAATKSAKAASDDDDEPITTQPWRTASWTAATPTPPVAPCTRT